MTIGAAASKPTRPLMPMIGIAYVHVAADRIARSNGLQRLNRGDPVVVTLTVQRDEFAPLESQRHTTGFGLFQLRRIGLLGSVSPR